MATLDGQDVFGVAVKISHVPYQNAHQTAEFQGLNGKLSTFMGSRGRTFTIEGVFRSETFEGCIAAEAVMRSFADGVARTLVDTNNRPWVDVIFKGEIQNMTGSPKPGSGGLWYWPYKLVMEGLS
jgi:hypothetical protein